MTPTNSRLGSPPERVGQGPAAAPHHSAAAGSINRDEALTDLLDAIKADGWDGFHRWTLDNHDAFKLIAGTRGRYAAVLAEVDVSLRAWFLVAT